VIAERWSDWERGFERPMNEADRTELERLIAAARPAGPSEHLDGRVRDALIGDAIPQSIRRERKPDRIRWLAIAASALIAAGVGFVGGRLTAGDDASRTVPAAPLSSVETSDLAERRDSNSTTPSLVA